MIYAYVCDRCGASFTVKATLAEKERGLSPPCPRCGSRDVTQDLSGVGVVRGPGAGGPSVCGPGSGAGCC
jgi:putative FmdB family regulatory protein